MWKQVTDLFKTGTDAAHSEALEMIREQQNKINPSHLHELMDAAFSMIGVIDSALRAETTELFLQLQSRAVAQLSCHPQSTIAGSQTPPIDDLEDSSLREWLWKPFVLSLRDSSTQCRPTAALIAVSDHEYIGDMPAFAHLCRHLSFAEFPNVEARLLPLQDNQREWSDLDLENRKAAAFVARPTLYDLEERLQLKSGRFQFPSDDEQWRSQQITQESQQNYHHIKDTIALTEYVAEQTTDTRRRTDYAVIRRVRNNNRDVLCISGITSLGTLGACQWIVSDKPGGEMWKALNNRTKLDDTKDVEILLKVEATAFEPKRPWSVETCSVVKLCVDRTNYYRQVGDLAPEKVCVLRSGASGATAGGPLIWFDGDPIDVCDDNDPIVKISRQFADNGNGHTAIIRDARAESLRAGPLRRENFHKLVKTHRAGSDAEITLRDGTAASVEFRYGTPSD